jgi:hypothetical protein
VTIPVQGAKLKIYSRHQGEPIEMRRQWRIRFASLVVLACAALVLSTHSQANHPATESRPTPGIYIPPNEQHPAVALPILRKSNHGVYVSVGTERSFIGAALTRAKGLFVIDYDAEAIRFANINRALLAASTDRADYVNMRLNASHDVWLQRSQKLRSEDRETLANPDSWTFWDKRVRKNESAWDNALKHFHTEPKKPSDPFFAADYLFNEDLYSHLRMLARSSRIWSRVVDLRHDNEMLALCTELKSKGLGLGVIDTSDVPNSSPDGTSVAARYIKLLSQCAQDDTLFLNTAPAGSLGVRWSYFAFTNKAIRGHDQTTIQKWFEIEMKRISTSQQLLALLDDADAISH